MTLHRPAVVSAVAAVTLAIAGLPAPPSTAATSVVTGVTDGQSLSGTVDFTFTAPAPGELEARVDGQPLAGTPMPEPAQFSVLHKGLDPVGFANALIVNEATSQPFTLSSANPDEWLLDPESLDIDLADLHEGENEIRIAAGSTTSAYVLGETPYGTNLDDFTFQQLSLTLPSGDTVAPTQIVYYLPVEVGSSEYTADERAYDPGTIYSIGDGWPGGSGIAAGLPVTVGAVFDLSADQLAPVIRAESYTLDTTTLSDGEHTLEFLADGDVLETLSVVIDNDAPAGPAVLDVLTADREWVLQREDSADVVWDADQLTMTNRVIDSTNMIGWPAVAASGFGNVDVTQTPYLFIDVDVAEGVNRSAWNLRFSNAAGTTTDLAPIFGYGAGSEVPASVTARIDVGTALRSLTVDGTIDLASVTISAVTELDTSVVFNEVYFAAEPKEGDDSAYAPPTSRPGSTMTFTQPRPEPDSAFSGIEDGVWYPGTVDFSVTAPEPAGVQLTVDGTELQGVGTPDPAQFSVLHRGLDPNGFANAVVVNDGEARPFATSSANPDEWLETSERITVALDELRVGRNEVRIAAGTSSEHYEPGETVYGTNLDDFDVQQLALLLPDGTEVAPSAVVEYLPEALDSVEYRTEESGYSAEASYAIGDGWPGGSGLAAGLPVGLGAVFELTADQLEPVVRSARYSLDTTTLADGEHTLEFSAAGEVIESLTIATNNASWREAQRPGYSARSSAAVDGGADVSLTVSSPSGDDIDVELVTARPFTVRGTAMTDAGAIPFTAEENAGLTRLGEQVATTTESAKPHHEFTVETGDYEGDVLVAYDGASRSGERVRLSVLDPATGTYDPLATETSTLQTSAVVDTDRYVDDGVITVRAEQVLVGNGNDTFLWASDSQHYSHFEQLAPLYTEVMSYAVEQYEAGEIAYVAHTGDLVEERGRLAEWQVADEAHRILDDAGVPYGVVSGNHDVGNHSAACGVTDCGDYTQFAQYFGSHRYEGADWYGDGLGDNVSHYDLVTIGEYDFVFLYLGMGREAGDDTVAWVEEVLAQYPNRNVIIGVHEYLDYDGTFYEDLFGDNVPVGQEVYDRIVVPNENVVAVISGHVAGAATEVHQIGDRDVVAMLANYQSVNISGLQNSTNTYFTSNGDAFVRLMTIADDALSFTTYSPYLDRYNAFTPAVDTGEVALDLVAPRRELLTSGFSAVPLDSVETVAAVEGLASGATVDERLEDIAPDRGWYAVLSTGPFTTHTPLVDVPTTAVPSPGNPAGTPGVEDPSADENAPVTEDMPDAGVVTGDLATTGVESIHLIALSVLLIAGSAVLLRVRARMRSVE